MKYVLIPAEGFRWAMCYGPFNSYDEAENFAIKNGLVASHCPRNLNAPEDF